MIAAQFFMSIISEAITERRISQHVAKKAAGRETMLRIIVVVVSIAVALIVAEVAMRAFDLGNTRTLVWYNNKILKLPLHARFMNYKENENLVVTNNWGFHDRERSATGDGYRILFLGDSFVEGRHVKTESLFTSRLEQKLTAAGNKVEAINGGVPGTGTAYQYVLWKEFFEPDIRLDHVVLCFFMGNDLTDNQPQLAAVEGSGDSGIFVDDTGAILDATEKPGLFKRALNSGRDHSVLLNTVYEGVYRVSANFQQAGRQRGPSDPASGRVSDNARTWEAAEQGTIALINRWQRELAGKKIPFDIVIIDRPGRVYNKVELKFLEDLQASCSKEQIGCLRLKLEGDPYQFYSFDGIALGHFNEKGHEAAAEEIFRFFEMRHQRKAKAEDHPLTQVVLTSPSSTGRGLGRGHDLPPSPSPQSPSQREGEAKKSWL